jgi:ornithine cyclodeaminase/alanine dehydrogenase-like protein (mu-crystallin family)
MYKEGLLQDDDIYADLGEIVTGRKEGRSNQNEFIYFNSVGLAVIDIYFAYEVYKMVSEARIGHIFNIQG